MEQNILRELFLARDAEGLAKALSETDPKVAEEFVSSLSDEELVALCHELDSDETADLLVKIEDSALHERIIGLLKDSELKEVMDEMSVDDTVDIIEDLPTDVVVRIAEEDEILRLLRDRNFKVL